MIAHFIFKFVITFFIIFPLFFFGIAFASNYDLKVEQLQRALILTGFSPGKADGLWGSKTESALSMFHKRQKMVSNSVDMQRSINSVYELWNTQQESDERSKEFLQKKIDLDDARHLLERVGIGANIKEVKNLKIKMQLY